MKAFIVDLIICGIGFGVIAFSIGAEIYNENIVGIIIGAAIVRIGRDLYYAIKYGDKLKIDS